MRTMIFINPVRMPFFKLQAFAPDGKASRTLRYPGVIAGILPIADRLKGVRR